MHRLDKDTSGILVAAKTDRAVHLLSEQFASRTAKRRYKALARGTPGFGSAGFNGFPGVSFEPEGVVRIESNLGRRRSDRIRMAVVKEGGRQAVTRVRPARQFAGGEISLLDCWLETGRTHQIRVHLSHIGHPLVGDRMYGSGSRLLPDWVDPEVREHVSSFPRQALHAASLEFSHPVSGDPMHFESPLPPDMAELLDVLDSASNQARNRFL